MKFFKNTQFCLCLIFGLILYSCQTIPLFEQSTIFPEHSWSSKQANTYDFNITDTSANYKIYFVIRHHNAYHYKNIWLQVAIKTAQDSIETKNVNLNMADESKGWMGTGMDDIFDQRIPLFAAPMRFKKGMTTFTIQHTMREDPLQNILATGIRVEKIKS
jgi:gliding motility-associated lipoprotein GldH